MPVNSAMHASSAHPEAVGRYVKLECFAIQPLVFTALQGVTRNESSPGTAAQWSKRLRDVRDHDQSIAEALNVDQIELAELLSHTDLQLDEVQPGFHMDLNPTAELIREKSRMDALRLFNETMATAQARGVLSTEFEEAVAILRILADVHVAYDGKDGFPEMRTVAEGLNAYAAQARGNHPKLKALKNKYLNLLVPGALRARSQE